jgi:hypothetical protein
MYVRQARTTEDYLEWIGGAFDPEKFNDDFEDSLRDTKSTLESQIWTLVPLMRNVLAISVERLMDLLVALGQDVDITVRSTRKEHDQVSIVLASIKRIVWLA